MYTQQKKSCSTFGSCGKILKLLNPFVTKIKFDFSTSNYFYESKHVSRYLVHVNRENLKLKKHFHLFLF